MLRQRTQRPFVGRTRELAALCEHLEATRRGEGGVVLIAGEPGIGKTRLLIELAERSRVAGWLVLSGDANEAEGMPPYLPFVEALQTYARSRSAEDLQEQLGASAADVALLVPEIRQPLPSLLATPPRDAQNARYGLFESVADFLLAVARAPGAAGLLLCLDDLHWADEATLLLLEHLDRRIAEAPLLVLAAYRDTEVDGGRPLARTLERLARQGRTATLRVDLGRFAEADTAALVAALAGREPPDQLVRTIQAETEGNPYFVHEVYRYLAAAGRLVDEQGAWRPGVRLGEVDLPPNVRLVLDRRLAQVSASCRRVLSLAAVIGRTFTCDLLGAVAGMDEEGLLQAIDEAERGHLVESLADDRAGRVCFAHELIRQTLLAGLSLPHRQQFHRRVAEAIERTHATDLAPHVAELAYHFAQFAPGDDVDKAIDYAVWAAERATAVLAFEEAARLYGLALQALDQDASDESSHALRAELHASCGTAFARVSAWVDARPELEAALATMAPERSERRAEVLIELSAACNFLLDNASVHHHASEALTLAEQVGRADLAAEALAWRSQAHNADGDLAVAMDVFRRAVACAGGTWPAALVMPQLIFYWLGRYDEAIAYARRSRQSAEAASDPTLLMKALGDLGSALTGGGCYDEGARVFDEARRFGRKHGVWPHLARVNAMAAGLYLDVFDFAGAEALSEEARDLARSSNFLPTIGQAGIDLLFNFARRGDLGPVEALMPEVEAVLALEAGWHEWLWKLRFAEARAEIALARGAWEEAIRWAEEAITTSRIKGRVKYEAAGLGSRAQALHALGRTREAIGDLRRAVALARPVGDPAMLLRAIAPLLAIAGDSALAVEARQAVDRSLAALPDADLRRRFETAESVRLVLRLTTASTTGMCGTACNDTDADSRPLYPAGLTAREVEVLRLLAAGTSNREIGAALVLSVRTVERHIENIYLKTGMHSRTRATLYAQEHHLL